MSSNAARAFITYVLGLSSSNLSESDGRRRNRKVFGLIWECTVLILVCLGSAYHTVAVVFAYARTRKGDGIDLMNVAESEVETRANRFFEFTLVVRMTKQITDFNASLTLIMRVSQLV